ncbi:hypothetical protein CC2G_014059 [Coprinopsis cinerea AmutBmut pab1-1]|nr:hypothetical protein CC2G_014059 [Coprinopsis cinerea AmutBmut pab1-1]
MVDLSHSSSRMGESDNGVASRQGLSTDIASLQSCLEGYTSHSENCSYLHERAISGTPMGPVKAITIVPVSRLAFPNTFPNSSPRRKTPTISPPPHRGFVHIPSPLAARDESVQRRPQPPSRAAYRRNHHHHGYSRQAFSLTKAFWTSRKEGHRDQSAGNSETSSSSVSPKPKVLTNHPKSFRPMESFESEDQPSSVPPLTIYPRRGDITALRDPYCVEADQCFANVPVWTLSKVLWVHDMHAIPDRTPTPRSQPSPSQELDEDPFDETASEISLDTTTSMGFSDDSESTLVESDPEWEPCGDVDGQCKTKGHRYCGGAPSHNQSAGSSSSSTEPDVSSSLSWAKNLYLRPPVTSQHVPSSTAPLNWYRRWDILLELSHCKKRPEKSPPTPTKPLPKAIPPKPVLPSKRLSFTRSFLTGLRNKSTPKPGRTSSYIPQDSFINPSHPAAG